ncbi:MAG: parallel beta-helix domain-containing protein [Saprospiraceae bacterium]
MKNILPFLFLTFFFSCQNTEKGPQPLPAETLVKDLSEKLITAAPDEVILLPEGTFEFQRPLSLDGVPNVTIKGMGMGKTILSFKGQIEGAEGLIIKNVEGLTLEGFTVADTKGDAIKVQACKNVTFRGMEATWTGGPQTTNGGYGLYPVSCTNVLMEKCEASFASDAGIYVGQSTNVVVRNNYAHDNVAGIEIENTRNADVYNNRSVNNSGGLLVFDMPDLPQANGYKIKLHDNLVENNNHPNFAAAGTVVATLPPGSGLTIMAHREIEAYNNTIKGHHTVAISVSSWLFTGQPFESKEYDPFCAAIYIHDNVLENNHGPMDLTTDFGKLLTAMAGGQTVGIAIDGIFNPETYGKDGEVVCFKNNGDVSFLNLNAGKGGTPNEMMQNKSTDITPFDCSLDALDISGHDAWLAAVN